jgi:phosphonate transport system substrate-binding protein
VPFDDAAQQEAVFGLLSKQLTRALGREVVFQTAGSYDEVIAKLGKGQIDVAFIGAAAYIQARRGGDVRAILRAVRHRASTYRGTVVVRADSPLKKLSDLKGKKFAFVDKSSGAGYFFPRLLLRQAGLDPDKDVVPVYAGGHHKVVQMVAAGQVDAGACFEGAEAMLEDPRAITPIARTEAIPGDPVVVRPGLGPDVVSKLRTALIELASVQDAATFFTFAEIDGFVPAVDRDYDRVAELVRGVP